MNQNGMYPIHIPELGLGLPARILPTANNKTSYSLPAGGQPYDQTWDGGACGQIVKGRFKGCLNIDKHNQVRLDDIDTHNKIYVKGVKRNCGRFECPECYQTWVAKSAKRIEHRFIEYAKMRQRGWRRYKIYPKHVTVSVPKKDYKTLEDKMPYYKRRIHLMLKKVGIYGGAFIYHPYRFRCLYCGENRKMHAKSCQFCKSVVFEKYYSPHFHIIGLGWIKNKRIKAIYEETDYVIKDINGGQRSIFRTAQYQLSHCGKKKGGRAFTWFGSLSYKKFKAVKFEDKGEPCPICGSIMVPLKYIGNKEEPLEGLDEYKKGCLDKFSNWVAIDKVRFRGY